MFSRLKSWGTAPLYNRKPERAPHFGTFCFPLCWRCTGILCGVMCGPLVLNFLALLGLLERPYIYILPTLLIVPLVYDGTIQYFFGELSNNTKRFVTGFLFGIGLVTLGFIG